MLSRNRVEGAANHSNTDSVLGKQAWRTEVTRAVIEAHAFKTQLAVIFIDVNNFKEVNDTLGHTVGDEVIARIRELLINNLRHSQKRPEAERDIITIAETYNPKGGQEQIDLPVAIGHIGGDEFGILCRTDEKGARLITERLRNAFNEFMGSQPEELRNLDISLALGVSVLQEGMSSTELLHLADREMYEDKLRQLPPLRDEQSAFLSRLFEELDKQNIRLRDLGKYALLLARQLKD